MTTAARTAARDDGAGGGRRVAGQDPAKRRQILDGASQVFKAQGFDAASMNDIAQAAGVSKGTLYVYFQNKEQLFIALIGEERDRHAQDLFAAMEEDDDVRRALTSFGRRLARLVSHRKVLQARRVVIGVAERMPEIGRSLFEMGPLSSALRLQAYLDRQVAEGRLVIPDTFLAAVQFLELCEATLTRPRLYGHTDGPPSDAEIARVVDSAVRLFLAAYEREGEGLEVASGEGGG